ncbi:MAG TPA: alpha/beta hydrolase, partial [Beijerinckiaceae bacterium]|nr:alpha/beta hydrolase [Beijerinckiaceae bacterium]
MPVVRLLAVAAVLYGAFVVLLFAMERTLLYPASAYRTTAAEAGLSDFGDITLTTADGERLVAWWKPPGAGRAVIVYFHGNGGSLWNRRDRARVLADDERGVLMASYRGYSGSTGAPTEAGLSEDARAAYAWAAERVDAGRLVLYGESLGSGVTVRLAGERPVGGLILEAPFTSTADVAKLSYWFVPVDFLMRDQFRSIDRIAAVDAPLLILH